MEKRYNPKEIEKFCQSEWERIKIFKFDASQDLKSFCIMMPPPNITGSLHMGHALTFTLQDVLIRFQKKLGKNALWQSRTDHAGIATEIIVEKQLNMRGIQKKSIGREKFIQEIWKWKKESGNKIVNQLKLLGTSVDWTRSRFTMDIGLSEAVNKVFVDLFDKNIIYKDIRLVNWDPKLQTAISDLEVNQKEIVGKLWYIKYPIFNDEDFIEIATTRPETMFGDSAIAIHPKNKNLKKYIGKYAVIPLSLRKIPIIEDEYADPKKGTGAVKITPAHDFNDFVVGKRNNLKIINIFNKNAELNEDVPSDYIGLNRFTARKKLLIDLKKIGFLVKEEKNKMIIPVGDRSGEIIEPYLTDQWFCNARKLSEPIKKFVKRSKINFFPKSWLNSFNYWIENIEPWCISRQIWWGHRIPAWYSDCGRIFVGKNFEEANKKASIFFGKQRYKLKQDNDVLDTWFSSALWPFSTLGWPEDNSEIKKFFPTDVLITGFDIIFFWVARMIMMGIHFLKEVPFKSIYIHPLVRDDKGQKMSKSKGNVIDPLISIEQYGADALRFTLTLMSAQGRDIKLSNKLIENNRNFVTKIWNLARFFELNKFRYEQDFNPKKNKLLINNWIFFRYCETQNKLIEYLKKFQFSFASNLLYQFFWHDLCDLYIELIKPYLKEEKHRNEINGCFAWVLKNSLNLINPFLPFVSEEISYRLGFIKSYSLISHRFYKTKKKEIFELKKTVTDFEKVISFIKDFREFCKLNNIETAKDINLLCTKKEKLFLNNNRIIFTSIFKIKSFEVVILSELKKLKNFVSSDMNFSVSEISNINKKATEEKIIFYKKEILYFKKKLSNVNFIKNAPKEVVSKQKEKLALAKKNMKILKNNLEKNNV